MKKILLVFTGLLLCSQLSAKKVKFAVDMTGLTISSLGVHVMGDFQTDAGFGANWTPGTTALTQEGTSNIYSIVVNLPAFKKYEFRFLNGDQTYEAEYVPEKCRVDEFVDNRWMYVDSLANDTSFLGAVVFAGSSPKGKTLLRYRIDMRVAGPISAAGVHVGTTYQSSAFSPVQTRMVSITEGIYEIIDYVTLNTYSYIFFNGNTNAGIETVPSACAVNGKRSIQVQSDTIINLVCFNSCAACVGVGIFEWTLNQAIFDLAPNPTKDYLSITGTEALEVTLLDAQGKLLSNYSFDQGSTEIDLTELPAGLYFIRAQGKSTATSTKKLIVE